jgi:hypothetical protein
MGWLWASSSDKASASPQQPPAQQPPAPSPPPSSAPNEPVDPEIQKFFELFGKDVAASKQPEPDSKPPPASSNKTAASSWLPSLSVPAQPAPTPQGALDPISEDLLPSDMSCRQAFDLAWQCNSLGGQWNAVYRYGSMRSCSENWDDFWFCMRTKSYSADMRERAIKEHYRAKEVAKYGSGKPSSEDIWEARTTKVEPGSTFAESFGAPKVDDEEWRRQESERRQQIRDGLGFNDKPSS